MPLLISCAVLHRLCRSDLNFCLFVLVLGQYCTVILGRFMTFFRSRLCSSGAFHYSFCVVLRYLLYLRVLVIDSFYCAPFYERLRCR